MSHRRFLGAGLALLIVIGLLAAGGTLLYRSGWSQGYLVGQLVASDDGTVAPFFPGYPGRTGGVSSLLCGAGLVVLLLVIGSKFFRAWAWTRDGGGPTGDGPRRWHHHRPPWCGQWETPPQEKSDPPAPEANAET